MITVKPFFRCTETEYLGSWINNNGVRPIPPKLDDIEDIESPTKFCYVNQFVVLYYYYRYMCHNHTHTIITLTKLCSTKVSLIRPCWIPIETL